MRTRVFWMLGLALILVGTAVFLAQHWLPSQNPQIVEGPVEPQIQMATVVVAATPLYFGNMVRREHLREIEWPLEKIPPGSFSTIDEVIGEESQRRVALRAIEIDEPLIKSNVSEFSGRASLSTILSPEMRALTIRVNDINGVAGFVLPGDHIDILLTRTGGGTKATDTNLRTDILVRNVKILAIDQDANEDRAQPEVTVEVTPVQAQKLVLAQRLGQLSLTLANITNVPAENTPKKKEGLSVRIVRGLFTTKSLSTSPSESKPMDLITNRFAPIVSKPVSAPFDGLIMEGNYWCNRLSDPRICLPR